MTARAVKQFFSRAPTAAQAQAETETALSFLDAQILPVNQAIQRDTATIKRLATRTDATSKTQRTAAAKQNVANRKKLEEFNAKRKTLMAPMQAVKDVQVNAQIIGALNTSQRALASAVRRVDVDYVEDVIDATDEALEDSTAINQALTSVGAATRDPVTESDVERELAEAMGQEEVSSATPIERIESKTPPVSVTASAKITAAPAKKPQFEMISDL